MALSRFSLSTGQDASYAPEGISIVSAPPVFTPAQIVQQLRTQWGGVYEGNTYDFSHQSSINYFVGGAPYASGSGEIPYTTGMTSLMQSRADLAFELWDDLIAKSLNKVNSAAENQIQFEYATRTYDSDTGTYTVNGGTYERSMGVSYAGTNSYGYNDYDTNRAEVWMNSNWESHDQDSDMYFGGYGLQTYMHEIGHALGLSHPGTYDASQGPATYAANAEYANDTRKYTIMSYFGGYEVGTGWTTTYGSYYSATPMMDDISAIQAIYGADMTTRSGNTVYGHNATADRAVFNFASYGAGVPIFTIWDGGGTDAIDASKYTQTQVINLAAGTYSSVGGFTENIAIARNVIIENAFGGSGRDTLIGNAAANQLMGYNGKDLLIGYNGNDTLIGGIDTDAMYGGVGHDVYSVDNAGDTVIEDANAGTDTVYANVSYTIGANIETLIVTGTAGNSGTGNAGANSIYGNSGNNTLNGAGGSDYLSGGDGADTLIGGLGIDNMRGDAGNDTYSADNSYDTIFEAVNGGSDVVYASANFSLPAYIETLILTGSVQSGNGNAQSNQMFGNAAVNVLDGRGGADYLVGNGGNDIFVMRRGEANGDIIADFAGNGAAAGDRLALAGYSSAARIVQVSATAWQIRDGSYVDTFVLANGASFHASDYYFA